MPNSLYERVAALRLVIDGMIQAEADSSSVTYDNIYTSLGFCDPPAGRDTNLWNLFSQVKREEWANTPENLGENFAKKIRAAYREATSTLDAEGEAELRTQLLAQAKTTAKKEINELASMTLVVNALTKAVRILSSYRSSCIH